MKTASEAIANSLTESQGYLQKFITDLTPAEYLHRPTPKANCTAWIIGHLILTERRGLLALKVTPPAVPEGFEKRFGRDPAAAEAPEFGDVTILPDLFNQQRALLIDSVKKAPADMLDGPLPFEHPRFKSPGALINFYSLHTAMHAGQITYIRRSLGKPPIV